ncbi:MAG: pseudouridine synthase, partial [Candidatus Woesearchaeota archaeon]|nr:pseudouridine synthase [Candidatus Woesearchaeota archaeon]
MVNERVQKILAAAGIASRRACEELIRQGRVRVNDVLVSIGATADSASDIITLDYKPIIPIAPEKYRYVLFYKPPGVLSSTKDTHGTTVRDLVPVPERLYLVGRLDKDAEGLILLTNDGELTQQVLHPSFETQKTYQATIKGQFRPTDIPTLRKGMPIDGRTVTVHHPHLLSPNTIELTLHEGRKHIVKRLLGARG